MANSKISALTAATTPVAGTETLPIVQGGVTKQVSIANLTAGRAVSAASLTLTGSPLAAGSGGTGSSSSFTANALVYASSTSALATSQYLTYASNALTLVTNTTWATTDAFKVWPSPVTGRASSSWYYLTGDGTTSFSGNIAAIDGGGVGFYSGSRAAIGSETLTLRASIDSNGNYIPAGASKGINFTANTGAAGKTSQLLNWYEEGTWTPAYTGWTTNPTTNNATYTRVGRVVTVTYVANDGVAVAGTSEISGLPFTSKNTNGSSILMKDLSGSSPGVTAFGTIGGNATKIASMSAATFTGLYWAFTATYIV